MGKKGGGSSWLTAVKRAFRSPSKDSPKKSCRRRIDEHEQQEEDDKKREKKRWLFKRASSSVTEQTDDAAKLASTNDNNDDDDDNNNNNNAEQKHAIAVATATAAAAEAAVVTAQAAVDIIRLTRSSNPTSSRQNLAAIIIQTAFRGFLARRALIALRGIVKLQALIRGQNVRKQAKMTLKCMQALLRVQSRLRDQRARLSHDGTSRRASMFSEPTNFWGDSKYLQDIRDRKSTSRDGGSIIDDLNELPRTLEELEAILEARKGASFRRERSLAYAFSQQWDDKELEEIIRPSATKQWDTLSRGSTDKRDSIKTVEVDTLRPYNTTHHPRKQYVSPHHKQSTQPQQVPALPRHGRAVTPSPSKTRPGHSRPASPARCHSTANTPSLRSVAQQRLGSSISRYSTCEGGIMPNYMAATESARAKSRSQSAPRSRPATLERDRGGGGGGLARKRLSYPVPESANYHPNHNHHHHGYGYYNNNGNNNFGYNLRSPSFKSVQGYMEQQSNVSCYTESIGGELSPCSTTDLRRRLR